MSNPYEVEHNIKPGTSRGTSRRVDMSSFQSFLSQLSTTQPADAPEQHNNPHATPTPVDTAALFQLVQQQMQTLFSTAPTDSNRAFLEGLVLALESDIDHPPTEIAGVSQEFLAELDRVDRRRLKPDDACPICAEPFLDDKYCLVVELPCHKSHRFDLECVSAWLLSKGNCPMCRTDLTKKKQPVIVEDSEEDEDPDGLYA